MKRSTSSHFVFCILSAQCWKRSTSFLYFCSIMVWTTMCSLVIPQRNSSSLDVLCLHGQFLSRFPTILQILWVCFRCSIFVSNRFVYVRLFCLFKVKPDLCEWMESLVRISMNKGVLSIQVYKRVGAVVVTVIQQQHETIAGRFLWSIKQLTQVSCCASETLITSSWTCLGLLATFLFTFFFCFSVFVSGNGRSFIAMYSW